MTFILQLQNVTQRFGGVLALDDVSLDIQHGSITGLIGPNGSGKTTAFSVISGFLRPTAGQVFFDGHNITGIPPHEMAQRGVARTFQTPQLFASLTIRETLEVAASMRDKHDGLYNALHTANEIGLRNKLDHLPSELTTADMRLVEIVKAFATGARLVLLDEVFAGLSSTEIDRTAAVIRSFAGEKTFVIIEHRMRAVMALCEHVHVLIYGRLAASGTPCHITNHPEVIAAYLGTEDLAHA
ncbi:ABC transporter ATP-binding protein [Alcaligenaceae bacterium]|nr:ABC transporter ATP-binding protein [Alcaligenaceae bacterium]